MAPFNPFAAKLRAHRGDRRLLSHYSLIPVVLTLIFLCFAGPAGHSLFSPWLVDDNPVANGLKDERSLVSEEPVALNVSKHQLSRRQGGVGTLGGDPDAPT
jgi:hypothetical protein